MSRLADKRYSEPAYEEFRELVEGWRACGGARSLAVQFEVSESTTDRWRLGTAVPHPLLRDQVVAWIKVRVA